MELCLFEGGQMRALHLEECTDQVWHGYLAGAAPGLCYAYRVHGPSAPDRDHRFDARPLLLDPYPREGVSSFSWPAQDDPAHRLKACVVDEHFDWGGDAQLAIPWADTVLYEVHVQGISCQPPGVPEALRGTYAGLAAPAMIEHYRRLSLIHI